MPNTQASDESYQLAAQLLNQIPELLKNLKRITRIPDKERLDLTYNQLSILFLLQRQHSLTMSELSRQLDVELSNATQMVDRLHKLDYLKRTSDTRDRRVVRINLSQKGKDLTTQYYQLNLAALAATLDRMESGKRSMLSHTVGSLINILSDNIRT
jgi:DNA-binding MarR family transcriptional regulator